MTAVVVLYPVLIPSLGHDPVADDPCDVAIRHGEVAGLRCAALVKQEIPGPRSLGSLA